jgi:hypothetical protein
MNRRWFLGSIAAAAVGAFAREDEPLVKTFTKVEAVTDGDVKITLEELQELLGQTVMKGIKYQTDGLRIWGGLTEDPGTVSVTCDLAWGGRVSWVEEHGGGLVGAVAAANASRMQTQTRRVGFGGTHMSNPNPTFLWRIGKLPLPKNLIEWLPANHRLGQWVRRENQAAYNAAVTSGEHLHSNYLFRGDMLP